MDTVIQETQVGGVSYYRYSSERYKRYRGCQYLIFILDTFLGNHCTALRLYGSRMYGVILVGPERS